MKELILERIKNIEVLLDGGGYDPNNYYYYQGKIVAYNDVLNNL